MNLFIHLYIVYNKIKKIESNGFFRKIFPKYEMKPSVKLTKVITTEELTEAYSKNSITINNILYLKTNIQTSMGVPLYVKCSEVKENIIVR